MGILILINGSRHIMCVTWTIHFPCDHNESEKGASNGCDGKCPGDKITYDERRDIIMLEDCKECKEKKEKKSLLSPPPTDDESSASHTWEGSSTQTKVYGMDWTYIAPKR